MHGVEYTHIAIAIANKNNCSYTIRVWYTSCAIRVW